MESLYIGINVIFPVFFVIFAGYVLRYIGYIDENFISKGNKLIFYVGLPAKLFFDMKNSTFESLNIKYVIFLLGAILFIYLFAWVVAKLFTKDGKKISAFVHCSYRSNFVYIGVPILDIILKDSATEAIVVALIFGLTLFNVLAIIVLSYYGEGAISVKAILIKIVTNPMIVAIFAGLFARLINAPIYSGIEEGCLLFAKINTPLSLALIGASLTFSKENSSDNVLMIGSAFIKTVLGALVFVPLAYKMGFNNSEITVAYVFLGSPCAVNCFIMGKSMGSDAVLTSKIITFSFILSVFTYTAGISLLSYFGII